MSKSRGSRSDGYAPAPSEDDEETDSIYSSNDIRKGGKAVKGKSAAQRRWRNMLVVMFTADLAANAGLYEMTHDFKSSCESALSGVS